MPVDRSQARLERIARQLDAIQRALDKELARLADSESAPRGTARRRVAKRRIKR